MIGVLADPATHAVISEFFELFKTPWEFWRPDRPYEVLLCDGEGALPEHSAKLVVIYGGRTLPIDVTDRIPVTSQEQGSGLVSYKGIRIPLYGDSIAFLDKATDHEDSHYAALHVSTLNGRMLVRLGYDLFREVKHLLSEGQPAVNASIPALELHIALLREVIIDSGIPLVEIPAVPSGYRLIACLTHDVDHPSLRSHKFDHTMFGFVYRAIFGSLFRVFRKRLPIRGLLKNWVAALQLPLVHLGIVEDVWHEFDRYPTLERGVHSSFFVIPFKGCSGRTEEGQAPARRAACYGAADIASHIDALRSRGCEIGLHGIDAWIDTSKGREELEELRRITGMQDIGVRMHWLYCNKHSPVILEQAGASYDSTVGYNETVGYRAGTTQVYKPLEATRLLELPLHVMDTALFYPRHLSLSPSEARERVQHIIDNAVQLGGCVTVNWHDRSIAPERLWGAFYVDLIDNLKDRTAWFATAADVVAWFRQRRSAVFEEVTWDSGRVHVKIAVDARQDLPPLQLRVHNGLEPHQNTTIINRGRTSDSGVKDTIDTCVFLS
jgi:hypothetical protein